MHTQIFVIAITAAFLIMGCSESTQTLLFDPQSLAVPAGVESTGPRLAAGPGSDLILSWMEPVPDGTAVRYSRYADGAWTTAQTVVEAARLFVNWADLPSVVPLGDEHLAAHWLPKSDEHPYAYDIVFAQSFDGGTTWSDAITPHTDGTETEHGFVSMVTLGQSAGLIWLDGRKMFNDVSDDPVASGMTLRAAVVDREQALQVEQLVDELICECCQTDVALAASGPVAVYRDRSASEIRDIYITRHIEGQWQAGEVVATDNWEIAGCPVNGPSIIADGASVVVAWFTAAEEPTVKVAFSADSGATFSAAINVIESDTLGRVGVVLLDGGDAAVSWLQVGESGSKINVRRVMAGGALGPIHAVTDSAAPFSVPQMVRSGDDLVFAWTESGETAGRVVSARVDYRSL